MSHIKNLKQKVERVLLENRDARNSDITLMIEIWKRYYPDHVKRGENGDLGIWFRSLYLVPREDNIKRLRAKIQNEEGRYLPTLMEVAIQRKINMDMWHKDMAFNQY